MKIKKLNDEGLRVFAIVLDDGDEAIESLTRFVRENDVTVGHLTAIGAFDGVILGHFNWRIRDYQRIDLQEQVEVVSLLGDVALKDGEAVLHVHVVLGRSDGSACGGHLLQARVRPTLEVIVTEMPSYLWREIDRQTGLPLVSL